MAKALKMFGIQFVNGQLSQVFTPDDACKLWKPDAENHVLELKAGGEIVFKSLSSAIMSIENLTVVTVFKGKYAKEHKSNLTGPDGKPLN